MTLAELRARLEQIETEARAIDTEAGDAAFTDDQQTRFDALVAERKTVTAKIASEEARAEQRASLSERRGAIRTESGQFSAPNVIVREDPAAILEDRSVTGPARTRALSDALLRSIEGHSTGERANDVHAEQIIKRHASHHAWAENLIARSTDAYASAFSKLMTGRAELLDAEERTAMSIGTSANGGYLVPTALDPTVMLTNSGSSNVMRAAGTRKVTLTQGNVWYGVTSAGATASWDAELAEVSDDSPTVGQASITCYKGKGFVQASVEAFEDIDALQADLLMILADAKDRLEGTAHMTGSGSAPQGLFTLVCASTTLRTTSTTAATIGEVDVHALYRALPIRWRGRGTFVMNPLYSLAIKRLGTAVSSAFSGDLTQPVTDRILGRPLLESDDAPTTQTTTALDQEIVFADLSAYTIVDKPGGTAIEYIPWLTNTANNLPDDRRGWLMRWRSGAGMPVLQAGVWLADKTSA